MGLHTHKHTPTTFFPGVNKVAVSRQVSFKNNVFLIHSTCPTQSVCYATPAPEQRPPTCMCADIKLINTRSRADGSSGVLLCRELLLPSLLIVWCEEMGEEVTSYTTEDNFREDQSRNITMRALMCNHTKLLWFIAFLANNSGCFNAVFVCRHLYIWYG